MRPINPHAGDRSPAAAVVTFYTRPPWKPGTALPVLAADVDALADALARNDYDDPDRWFAGPVSVTADEPAAFAAWCALSLYRGPVALRLWRATFPAPAGVDPLAELVDDDDAPAVPVSPSLPPGA